MEEQADGTVQVEGTPEASGQPEEYSKGDYNARIMNEPDFALKEIQAARREASQAHNVISEHKGLHEVATAAGGVTNALQFVQSGWQVGQVPGLQAIVDEAVRTGQVPTIQSEASGQPSEDDAYVDPDVRDLRQTVSEMAGAIKELTQANNQRFAKAETRGYKVGIDSNIKSVLTNFGGSEAVDTQLLQTINERVQEAQKRATNGDEQSLGLLEALAGPNGLETMEMMVMPVVKKNLGAIAAARENIAATEAQNQSTGEPGTVRSMPTGTVPKQNVPPIVLVRQGLEANARKVGLDPNKVFGSG